MESRLEALAARHLADVMPLVEQVVSLQKQGAPFASAALPVLLKADRAIAGAGMHHSIFVGDMYYYPFNQEFDAVLRPIRYVLNELSTAYDETSSTRFAVATSGGHLESCLKVVNGRRYQRKPLGAQLLNGSKAVKLLDEALIKDMDAFTQLAVNPSKHDYAHPHSPEPLFKFTDTVYAYFLARRFGAEVLTAAGRLDGLIEAVESAAINGPRYRGSPLPFR